jgi:hypothetical protein
VSPRDGAPVLRLRAIRNLRVSASSRVPDTLLERVSDGWLR